MLKNMNFCTMSYARTLFKIIRLSNFLYLNRLSDVFLGKHTSAKRLKTVVVETGGTSSFRRLSTFTATKLQRPISTAIKCGQFKSSTSLKLLTYSQSQSISAPLAERNFSNNPKVDYDIQLRVEQKGDPLSDKLKNIIHRRLLVATDEYLQLFGRLQSTTPATAKGCEYKIDCNATKSLNTSRSASLSSKMIWDMLRPIQSKYGQSTIRNFSNTSST